MADPVLDRPAARCDPSVLDRREERPELLYRAELSGFNLRFDPKDDAGRENVLREWEHSARRDRE